MDSIIAKCSCTRRAFVAGALPYALEVREANPKATDAAQDGRASSQEHCAAVDHTGGWRPRDPGRGSRTHSQAAWRGRQALCRCDTSGSAERLDRDRSCAGKLIKLRVDVAPAFAQLEGADHCVSAVATENRAEPAMPELPLLALAELVRLAQQAPGAAQFGTTALVVHGGNACGNQPARRARASPDRSRSALIRTGRRFGNRATRSSSPPIAST